MEILKYPSTGEWINTLWYVHTVKYYEAIKGNKLLLEQQHRSIIMISERSQTKRIHKVLFHS